MGSDEVHGRSGRADQTVWERYKAAPPAAAVLPTKSCSGVYESS